MKPKPDMNFLHDEVADPPMTGRIILHVYRGVINLEQTEWRHRGPRRNMSPIKGRHATLEKAVKAPE